MLKEFLARWSQRSDCTEPIASQYVRSYPLTPSRLDDLAALAETEGVTVRELPGIIERHVTYESHRLFVIRKPAAAVSNPSPRHPPMPTFYVVMEHGGGVEYYRAEKTSFGHDVLELCGEWDNGKLYKILYALRAATTNCFQSGVEVGHRRAVSAFAQGRMTKRKVRGQDRYEVKIEPQRSPA